jgi:glycosyltransferase involved in cell wall biosynthesis
MLIFDLVLATRRPAMTGVERYGVHLFNAVRQIEPDAVAFVRDTGGFKDKRGLVVVSDVYRSWLTLPLEIRRLGLAPRAAVFPTAPASPLFGPTKLNLCRIVHDVFPWTRSEAMPLKGRLLYRDVESLMAKRYDLLCGTTEIVADELRAQLKLPEVNYVGNAPGIDLDGTQAIAPPGLPAHFILAVGTVEPRKDYGRLIELVESRASGALPIVLVGRPGWGDIVSQVEAAAARRPERLIWLRDLTEDGALIWLYRRAACFLSLSKAEGFNMPLVESAMCGRAVVCSDLPIHRVVAPPWVRFVSSDIPADALWSQIRLASQPEPSARDAYSRRYGWSSVATRLLSLLERDE